MSNKQTKEEYDRSVPERYKNEYEFNRWFLKPRTSLDYAMIYRSVVFHTSTIPFDNALEVGPGPGTWTKVLYRYHPTATFTLVDISNEMQKQFELEMRKVVNVSYEISDIMEFKPHSQFGFFFSSRAIEYMDNPSAVLEKTFFLLAPGSRGVIITKNPSYLRIGKIFKREREFHTGDIAPATLSHDLSGAGFTDIRIFPCIFRVPILDRFTFWLSHKLFEKKYREKTNKLSRLAESYVVTFQKPKG